MCKPDLSRAVQNVVVAGAGPAGLLLSSMLLKNNSEQSNVRYNITLIDAGENFGKLDPKTELKKHRSWMIGLTGHGLEALRTIPELYTDYVSDVGVRIESFSLYLGAKEIKNKADGEFGDTESYIVDRNYICAAIARYLNDKHSTDPCLTSIYRTKLMYVDGDNKRVLVRDTEGKESYIDYDLLLGCDGVRSRVRDAILQRHKDFECDIGDIFQNFKAVHVATPPGVDQNAMHVFPECFPDMQGAGLPEKGSMLNISIGGPRHKFDELPEEIKSDDPAVVAKYFKENFKAFELVDYDDFARQWVGQRWNRTGMVHCNFYHSLPQSIVILGDAAHATSPSIGQGMNTALRDAAELVRLLDEHNHDLNSVLPAFSEERVKEGNSLPDLAMHLYCLDSRAQLVETLHMVIRGKLSMLLPWLVDKHPQMLIGQKGVPLSSVYDLALRQGIIAKHRAINDRIRRDFFEKSTGMVETEKKSKVFGFFSAAVVVVIAAGAAKLYLTQ